MDHHDLTEGKALRSPALDAVVTAYTNICGSIGMPLLAVDALLILSIRLRSRTPGILNALAETGSPTMTVAAKQTFGRARPDFSDGVPTFDSSPSFPR